MKTLALLSLAAPGAMIAGYVVLTGYLISRIQPVPIAFTHGDSNTLRIRPSHDDIDGESLAVAV
jgi:hypothetical protein